MKIIKDKEHKLQILLFLVLWPLLNFSFVSALLAFQGKTEIVNFTQGIIRVWSFMGFAYLLIQFTNFLSNRFTVLKRYNMDLFIQGFLIIFTASLLSPPVAVPEYQIVRVFRIGFLSLEVIVYIAMMLLLRHQEKEYESRLNMQQAELSALRMQTNPHFLFNTLNLISYEIDDSNHKAKSLIFDLADLLRQNIELGKRDRVKLEEELLLARLYLTLQKKRYQDKFTFDIDYEDDVSDFRVPSLFLLPIIENAVKHGVEPFNHKAHISVLVDKTEKGITVKVIDSGSSSDLTSTQPGNGLRILHQTLKAHFGNDYRVKLLSGKEDFCVTITLPYSLNNIPKD